jgi:hypothetical protein
MADPYDQQVKVLAHLVEVDTTTIGEAAAATGLTVN